MLKSKEKTDNFYLLTFHFLFPLQPGSKWPEGAKHRSASEASPSAEQARTARKASLEKQYFQYAKKITGTSSRFELHPQTPQEIAKKSLVLRPLSTI